MGVLVELPGTWQDSFIWRMSRTYSLANAANIGSRPHNMEESSSARSAVAACILHGRVKTIIYLCTSPVPSPVLNKLAA